MTSVEFSTGLVGFLLVVPFAVAFFGFLLRLVLRLFR